MMLPIHYTAMQAKLLSIVSAPSTGHTPGIIFEYEPIHKIGLRQHLETKKTRIIISWLKLPGLFARMGSECKHRS